MGSLIVPSSHVKGELRRLMLAIALSIAMFGAMLLAIIAYAGWKANDTSLKREKTLVQNALDQGVSRILNEQKSIAWWDDAVEHIVVHGLDISWTDTNFGVYLNETYGHDEIYILNNQDEPIYAYVSGQRTDPNVFYKEQSRLKHLIDKIRDRSTVNLLEHNKTFEKNQSSYKELLGARLARLDGHILSVNGKPAIVSAITIVPNLALHLLKGPPYILISVVYIDEPFIQEIGQSILLPDLTLSAAPPESAQRASQVFTMDDNAQAGFLSWTAKRPGQILIEVILPLVTMGVLGAGIISANIFRRLKLASSELAKREEKAQYAAHHDALSGLPNRTHFISVLETYLSETPLEKESGRGHVIAYVDIDRFKDVNDTLGHHAGDELIIIVSERLKNILKPQDFLARFGGDEFAIVRPNMLKDQAQFLAEELEAPFQRPCNIFGQVIQVTASVGIAVAPDHGSSTEELMRHADIALYQAKDHGRNRWMLFCDDMALHVEERRAIELELRKAIKDNRLSMQYQPIVSSQTYKVTGVEALLRWKHPIRGYISPALFIPIAEDAGIMPELGTWVLEQAFADSVRWPDLEIAINLSPIHIRHAGLFKTLQRLIWHYNADPGRFILEITEGVLMDSTERTKDILNEIQGLGFKMALDDFGTGYSSLKYLREFHFNKIKIDQSFVQGVTADSEAMTIIQAVVALGRGLQMDVIAEGVETETEDMLMRLSGCTHMQGYRFSKALPPDLVQTIIDNFSSSPEHALLMQRNPTTALN